jgi:DNA-binding MarR family transcriptional regulator
MNSEILERVAPDLLSLPPLIFRLVRRKLLMTSTAETDTDIKLIHFEIMKLLKEEGTLHPAEIGGKLQIAKAQMTHLIDKLVEKGFVTREMCPDDRRTINITLTEKGNKLLEEQDNMIIKAVWDNMSSLSDAELEVVSNSLRTLRDILLKLQ